MLGLRSMTTRTYKDDMEAIHNRYHCCMSRLVRAWSRHQITGAEFLSRTEEARRIRDRLVKEVEADDHQFKV